MKHPIEIKQTDWEALDEGDTIRIPCSHWRCDGKPASFTITRTNDGCIYNCYRCGCPDAPGVIRRGSTPNRALSKLDRLRSQRHKTQANNAHAYKPELPRDFIPMVTHDKLIPPQALAWFYRYELTDDDMDTHYIGYSPKLERVICPIYSPEDKLLGWQGRDIFYTRNKELYSKNKIKKQPLKYYTEYNNKLSKIYFKIYNNNNIYKNIIIVEDILSCIKVYNKYKYNSVALLNSNLNTSVINDLDLRSYSSVLIWLDPDAHLKSMKGAVRWQQLGVNAVSVRTDGDPKEIPYVHMPNI